jgi:hypothetical protein
MKAKIFRILGGIGFLLAIGSLSACFVGPPDPGYPRYSYGGPAYAYPEYHPGYAPRYVPAPRSYASNPHAYRQNHQRLRHEEREHQE